MMYFLSNFLIKTIFFFFSFLCKFLFFGDKISQKDSFYMINCVKPKNYEILTVLLQNPESDTIIITTKNPNGSMLRKNHRCGQFKYMRNGTDNLENNTLQKKYYFSAISNLDRRDVSNLLICNGKDLSIYVKFYIF